MQLVSTSELAPNRLSALYIDQNRWALPWLRGRTVATPTAVAAIHAGEALLRGPAEHDPVWSEIHCGAIALGFSAREFAAVLGSDRPIPEIPRRGMMFRPSRGE